MNDSKLDTIGPFKHHGDELHLFLEVFRTYQALISGFSSQTGMPASRFGLMRVLAHSERGLGVVVLARRLGINPAAVTRQLQDLESEGLVTRRSDARDGRRSYVTLSEEGLKRFEELHARTHELEKLLAAAVGTEELAAAAGTLSKVRSFLESLK